MPRLIFQNFVPGSVDQVWEQVTACSATGRIDRKALREKYGTLIAQDGDTYTFKETLVGEDAPITWRCSFERPNHRAMTAEGKNWADRYDYFQPMEGGTWWSIVWVPKAGGLRAYSLWLGFQIRSKRRIFRETVQPVLDHFMDGNHQEGTGREQPDD
ncbi:MAG: hypothetical protein IIC99_08065 [Chloroflexi bacterium]|nr:hypothetical protein [Chloroflexota bacterium]